jgi:hypothetical protein
LYFHQELQPNAARIARQDMIQEVPAGATPLRQRREFEVAQTFDRSGLVSFHSARSYSSGRDSFQSSFLRFSHSGDSLL